MKSRLLDLFSGAGGCSRGYQMAGFHVTGVDNRPMPRYAGDCFIQADALEYVAAHGHEFDAIHASPPCQGYTSLRGINIAQRGSAPEHPDLIAPTRRALSATGKPYVIENVQNSPLETQIILCAASFGLKHLARHRHFESNILLPAPPKCSHHQEEYTIGVYGDPNGRRVSERRYRLHRAAKSLEEGQMLMGIDWMIWDELRNAIPPIYCEWIGRHLLEAIRVTA